jgi:hypothetical protein
MFYRFLSYTVAVPAQLQIKAQVQYKEVHMHVQLHYRYLITVYTPQSFTTLIQNGLSAEVFYK